MSKLLVLLDLDRTVFDTARFTEELQRLLRVEFDIPIARFQEDYGAFCAYNGRLRHYDFFGHMQRYGIPADDAELSMRRYFAEADFAYDDVPDFLEFLQSVASRVQILTYGESRFQHLKHQLAPCLTAVPCIDVLEPKGPYIARAFPGEIGLIIDDRPVDDLPEQFQGLRLLRKGIGSGPSYASLAAVKRAWPEIVMKA